MKVLNKRFGTNRASSRRSRHALGRAAVEVLEERRLLTTVVVNSISDAASPLVTLRDAVSIANSSATPTTITFSSSVFATHKTIILNGTQLELKAKKAVTITGPTAGVTISGNAKSRVFLVDAGVTATFSGLTITDGHAPASNVAGSPAEGGGVENSGTLTLSHCNVTSDTAAGAAGQGLGGGIASFGPLTLQSCTVSSNTASGADEPFGVSGYAAAGGGVYATASVAVSGSNISHNSTVGGTAIDTGLGNSGDGGQASGGGIYAKAALSLTSSTVSANSVAGGDTGNGGDAGGAIGGGVYSALSATLTSTTVTGNTATGGTGDGYNTIGGVANGAGVYGVSLVVAGSTITSNKATAGVGQIGSGQASGGGVFSSKSLDLVETTISGNTALGANGFSDGPGAPGLPGGAGVGGGIFSEQSLSVLQSTINANSAFGGAGYQAGLGEEATAGPGGAGSGGGIFSTGAATITDSTVANNAARGGEGGDANLSNPGANGGAARGGGIDSNGTLKLFDSTLSGNSVVGGAGGAKDVLPPDVNEHGGATGSASGGALTVAGGTALADNSILSANNAGGATDISGVLLSTSSHNLIGTGGGLTNGVNGNHVGVTNPKLSALGNNGGPTQTMVPLTGSVAINAGSNALIPAGIFADQRGLPRISGGTVDIGAVEVQAAGGASIAGTFYNDLNHNGIHSSNEPGLSGWQVYIDANNNGVFDPGEITTYTTSNGGYKLTGLAAGTYIIREVRPDAWTRTEPAGAYPLGYYKVTVATNQAAIGKDFGDYLT